MVKMKNAKLHMMDRMERQNQEKIRTLKEKETYKYMGILEAETIKQVEMKEKNTSEEPESYSRQNSIAGNLSK